MANYNPFAELRIEELTDITDPTEMFKDIPYIPTTQIVSDEDKARLNRKIEMLRQTIKLRDLGQLNDDAFYNERLLISYHHKLYLDDVLISSEYALQQAIDTDYRADQDMWFKIADALEKRKTYEARAF